MEFNPKAYLKEYYQELSNENLALLDWYIKIYKSLKGSLLLEVGGGPTIYQLISAAPNVEEIIFTDFSKDNLKLVKEWSMKPDQFWDKFILYVLKREKCSNPEISLNIRKNLVINKISRINFLDASKMSTEYLDKFDIVQSNFCIDSSTDNEETFICMLNNIYSYLKAGGQFNMAALEKAQSYKLGETYFPAFYLTKTNLKKYLKEAGFKKIKIKRIPGDNPVLTKYQGFLLVTAMKL